MSVRTSAKTSKQPSAAKRKPRNPSSPAAVPHAELCQVCKHPAKSQIQHEYMAGASGAELAEDYGLTPESVQRHARYFNLVGRRACDVKQLYWWYLSRNLERFLAEESYSAQNFIKVAEVLAKLPGEHPGGNAEDPDRERKLRFIKRSIDRLILQDGKTEPEAIAELTRQVPETEELIP